MAYTPPSKYKTKKEAQQEQEDVLQPRHRGRPRNRDKTSIGKLLTKVLSKNEEEPERYEEPIKDLANEKPLLEDEMNQDNEKLSEKISSKDDSTHAEGYSEFEFYSKFGKFVYESTMLDDVEVKLKFSDIKKLFMSKLL